MKALFATLSDGKTYFTSEYTIAKTVTANDEQMEQKKISLELPLGTMLFGKFIQ